MAMTTKGPAITPKTAIAPSPVAMSGASSPNASSPGYDTPVNSGLYPDIQKPKGPVKQIITSKEWVLPPRPKPGRKPSVDTPASKRKAQNRAAQRAFRERRATRVQELEQKLMEVEKEKEVKEMGLVNTINKLKAENQYLMKSLEQIRGDSSHSRKAGASHGIQESESLKDFNYVSPNNQANTSPASSSYSVQQISPAPSADSPPTLNTIRPNISGLNKKSSPNSLGRVNDHRRLDNDFECGVCEKEECLCETVGLKEPSSRSNKTDSLKETLSSFSPMEAVPLKKRKVTSDSSSEIDFTKQFITVKKMPELKKARRDSDSNSRLFENLQKKDEQSGAFNESSPMENCGFCSDDTPCVCREAAKEAARLNSSLNEESEDSKTELPPIQVRSENVPKTPLPVMHPGPSVEIRDITNLTPGAVPTVVSSSRRGTGIMATTPTEQTEDPPEAKKKSKEPGCTGNPGTCAQCQSDPLSTLFCTTVASKVSTDVPNDSERRISSTSSGSNSASSVISLPEHRNSSSSRSSTPSSMFIPCADAYKTLSRHKKFNSVDFSTLVGKLTTRGMQVEVQSVANVLRDLDRRIYN